MKPKQLVNVLLFSENRKEYLFKCKSCGMIVSADFGEEYFLDILDNKFSLECLCGEESAPLFD